MAAQLHYAQTELDGIMMKKNNFCTGLVYEYSSWDKYWEGTFKRENLNFGTVSNQKIWLNGNYGITSKLNFIFNIPYVKTNASAGTFKGQDGLQDLSLNLKYLFYEKEIYKNLLSFYAVAGYSFPTTDYPADYLPLSIGLQSKVGSLRLISDYQFGNLFATASAAYMKRSNITIDRNSYYTTEMHYTNEVDMPDMINCNIRFGFRNQRAILEAVVDNMITQKGGFDITTNNMPFPSNTMNAMRLGVSGKYNLKSVAGLSLVSGFNHVASGRNIGQSDSFYGGLFYVIDFKNVKPKTTSDEN